MSMNKSNIQFIICLTGMLFFTFVSNKASAQCNDITLNLSGTNSTCLSNGKIKVTLSGNDVSNIRQSDMQFQVAGTQNHSWTNYPDNTIPNLPAGTYTISLRAFCNTLSDWVIATTR